MRQILSGVNYTWEEEKLRVSWSNAANSDDIFFNKYQIILSGINSDDSYVQVSNIKLIKLAVIERTAERPIPVKINH